MVEIFDVVRLIKDNPCMCGLSKDSEHIVAWCCNDCEMLGIIADVAGMDKILYVSYNSVAVVGEAVEDDRRRIREIAYKYNSWECDHNKSVPTE